jgi:hypothetical protein
MWILGLQVPVVILKCSCAVVPVLLSIKGAKLMRKALCAVLCFAVLFAGCAGREAKPILISRPGDDNLSCQELKSEVVHLQNDMVKLLPKTDKFGTNALWATAGVYLIVPFFFMDLKDAEKKEFEAMRLRHNRLVSFLKAKSCDVNDIRAEPIPDPEQEKKTVEDLLNQQKTENK